MNCDEAKFILRAYRSDGRYASTDPLFVEALAEAQRDPALSEWLGRENAFDAAVANKLEGIPPPAGLRESIVFGARASRSRRRWWRRQPLWLVAAAVAFTLLLAVPALVRRSQPHAMTPAVLAEFAVKQLAAEPHRPGSSPEVEVLRAQIAAHAGSLGTGLSLDAEQMRRSGCRTFAFAGHEIFEVCFQREGLWYHLYVTRAGTDPAAATAPSIAERNGIAVATWSDARSIFALVSQNGLESLRRVL